MAVPSSQIVYGAFKGMGDLLWAAPVITSELERGREVHLLLFPSAALRTFCSLLDFGPGHERLWVHALPRNVAEASAFIRAMSKLSPELVWISPHAPAIDASWKIPFALWLMRKIFWRRAQLTGAASEKMSWLFDRSLPVNRGLPLKLREWSMYRSLRGGEVPETVPLPRFDVDITELASLPPLYDLVIHPGASAANRLWPAAKYRDTVALLPRSWKIAVLGLPADIDPLRELLPAGREVEYISGSLRLSLETIASARRLLVVDSGNMHFAEVLGRPTVAVFGKDNPSTVVQPGVVQPVYQKNSLCQPCGRTVCSQPELYCLTKLPVEMVAERLLSLPDSRSTATAASSLMTIALV